MKFYSWFSVLVVVVLSACGTFEVSIEQPTPTTTPAAINSDHLQGMEQSMIGHIQEGDLFVGEETTGWSKMVIVSGDVNWIAMIDNAQMIVLVYHPESQTALVAVDGNGKGTQELGFPENIHHNVGTDSSPVVTGLSWIQWSPDSHLHQQSLKTHSEGVVSDQQLDSMPTLLVTETASILFLNSSNRLPVWIDFADTLNTSPIVND